MSLSAVRCQNQSTALIPLDRTQTFPVRHAFHPVWSKIESMAESWGRSRAHVYGSHLGPGFVVGDRHEQYITWRKTTERSPSAKVAWRFTQPVPVGHSNSSTEGEARPRLARRARVLRLWASRGIGASFFSDRANSGCPGWRPTSLTPHWLWAT